MSASATGPADRRRWLVVAALLCVAALLRIATLFYHEISGDDATVALMAKHILAGENFPAFFYRQTYIGAPTGFHLVPALFVFGPSVLLVRLHEVVWNLVFLVLLYACVRQIFGETAGRAALALGAVPPFLLTYWMSVAEPHFTTNTFAAVLVLLVVAALRAERGPRYGRVLLVFGLAAGLAWWQNFKTLEILLPALLVLWVRDPWLPLRSAGAGLAAGFLLGSLPAWLFYATRGDAPGYARRLFQAGLGLSLDRLVGLATTVVPTLLGTYYWPADSLGRRVALGAVVLAYAAAVGVAVVEAARGPWRGRGAAAVRAWGTRLLVLALVVPFGMLYGATYVAQFDHETARYVLPVYLPLLAFAGALVARLGRRSRVSAAALLAGLLAFDLWTNAGFLWPLDAAERARRQAHVATREAIAAHLRAHPVDALYVDDGPAALRLGFLLDLPVSELVSEIYVPSAVAADAARRIAILHAAGDPTVSRQLAQLGARHRSTTFGLTVLEDEIMVAGRVYRPIPRVGWRIADVSALADGDLATAVPRGAAGELVVDLGAAHAVGRVVWWPPTDWEQTQSLAVSGSLDGVLWQPIGTLPSFTHQRRPAFVAGDRPVFRPRHGWLELRRAPAPLRYLRFAPMDPGVTSGWGIAELLVYEDAGSREPVDPDPGRLAARLRALGVTRLLADPVVSARTARATEGTVGTLPANGVLDNHGRTWPPARLGAPVRLRGQDALLVPPEEAEELYGRLRAAGVDYRAEAIAEAVLVHHLAPVVSSRPCRSLGWRVTAGATGPPGDRLATVVEARLPEAQRLTGLRIEHPLVSARYVAMTGVAVSDDGRAWRPAAGARLLAEWGWAGRTLFRYSEGFGEIWVPPTPARHVRVELTTPDVEGRSPITRVCARGEGSG